MPKIDLERCRMRTGSRYPPPFDEHGRAKTRWKLSEAVGLTQFGVNLLELPPGDWSSQRHWHAAEDEFVFVVSGELVLIDDLGEHPLKAGDCAGFKAGEPNGHHLVNRSDAEAVVLEMGSRRPDLDSCTYPDIGMFADADGMRPLSPGAAR
jgi:uncharacterized cupin superfamily protein